MYTGRHLQNKKVIKHSKTGEYYIISHPKEVNLKTGNACIKIKDIERILFFSIMMRILN